MTKTNERQKNAKKVRKNKSRKGATALNKQKEKTVLFGDFFDLFTKQLLIKSVTTLSVLFFVVVSYISIDKLVSIPLSKVTISGDLFYADQNNVKKIINDYADKGFILVDLKKVKADLESLPWVHQVKVTRQWPDKLQVELKEESPIAFWGDSKLINHQGDLFEAKQGKKPANLPSLNGPDNHELAVMREYEWLSHMFSNVDLKVMSLSMDNKGSIKITLNNQIDIELGSDDLVKKTQRFLKAYHTELHDLINDIATIDLRYTNGLAVGWKTRNADEKHQLAGA